MSFYGRLSLSLVVCTLSACAASGQADLFVEPIAAAKSAEESSRIVAIGDVHGDYEQFRKLLQSTGLIDDSGSWIAGNTRFVQLGDIPDRGPDSRKAIDLLRTLQRQAADAGGAVHVLIGNHESMMIIGDLRYVHPGEYEAFIDGDSEARRDAYYKKSKKQIRSTTPKSQWPTFNQAYRDAWEDRFPLGYVEHRLAWAPTGQYGEWVLSNPAVLKLDDTLFVHGGLSPDFAHMRLSEINTRVRTALAQGREIAPDSIVESPTGPLWDRAWGTRVQSQENEALLDRVLAAYAVKRMVIAHTPLAPIVLPRFNGKVLMADVGLSGHYGHGFAALEIDGKEAFMLLGDQRISIPAKRDGFDAYFDAAEAAVSDPAKITRYRELTARQEREAVDLSVPQASGQID